MPTTTDRRGTPAGPPDLILQGGEVITFAGWRPGRQPEIVSALAVRGGIVVAAGTDEDVSALAGPSTRVIDLAGRCVVPGINDTHLHLACYAMARFGLRDVSAEAIGDWSGLRTALRADAVGPDGWIRAQGWDASGLGREGTAADIDAALAANGLPEVPAVLFDRTGHQLLAGTAALRRLGIDRATADPPGGVVARDASGAPTGLFIDAATALVLRGVPAVAATALRQVLDPAQRELAALGITSVTDPAIGPGHATLFDGSASPAALEALAGMAADGDLRLRTTVLLSFAGTGGESVASIRAGLAGGLREAFASNDPRMLRIAGVKVFADGIQRSGTAWHFEPYGSDASRGRLAVAGSDDDERAATLRGVLAEIAAAGLQAGVHATGDAAAAAVVDALAATAASAADTRPYLIHGDFLPADGMAALAALGIGWTANPAISRMVSGIGHELLGAQRQSLRQPLRSALLAGVTVTLSSDAPVVSPDWREAVIAAVERSQIDGRARPGDHEALTTTEALATMTVLAARLDRAETWKGRLAPGFVADLAVLSGRWPRDQDVRGLRDLRADLTVLGGQVIHEAA